MSEHLTSTAAGAGTDEDALLALAAGHHQRPIRLPRTAAPGGRPAKVHAVGASGRVLTVATAARGEGR